MEDKKQVLKAKLAVLDLERKTVREELLDLELENTVKERSQFIGTCYRIGEPSVKSFDYHRYIYINKIEGSGLKCIQLSWFDDFKNLSVQMDQNIYFDSFEENITNYIPIPKEQFIAHYEACIEAFNSEINK